MEVAKEIQREYNPNHPNYERWQLARNLSDDRAKFVERILSTKIKTEGLNILEIGAGEGSTSRLLSKNNQVISIEPKSERVNKIKVEESLHPIMADAHNLPFKSKSFNLIILQDVIEHLRINLNFVGSLNSLLKINGVIYLSTPNRFSLFNIISDPHWGIPFLCLFRRDQIKKYFLKYFRKSDENRNDIAELLSLKEIIYLFDKNFSLNICTNFSVNYLLSGGKGLIWSNFHLRLVKFINYLHLENIIRKIANDRAGFINNFFTPTFYIILKKNL